MWGNGPPNPPYFRLMQYYNSPSKQIVVFLSVSTFLKPSRKGIVLGVHSPFFSTIVLFKNQLFTCGSDGFLERRIPGKNGEVFSGIVSTLVHFTQVSRVGLALFPSFALLYLCCTCLCRVSTLGLTPVCLFQAIYRRLSDGKSGKTKCKWVAVSRLQLV